MKLYKNTVLTGIVAMMMSSAVFACDLSKITFENAYVLAAQLANEYAGYATIKNSGDSACDIVGAVLLLLRRRNCIPLLMNACLNAAGEIVYCAANGSLSLAQVAII